MSNATHDITDVRYSKPRGFVYSSQYRLVHPGEQQFNARFLVPRGTTAGNNLDIIALVLYRLPSGVSVFSPPDQLSRLKYYNRRSGAVVQNGIHRTSIGGYPALQENAVEQGSNTTYRYAAWFVFGLRHVVLISCQVDRQVNKVAKACGSLIESLKFH